MWFKITVLLILGYLSMTRSFAYLGLPVYQLFLGEAVLAIFLLTHPRAVFGRWFDSLFNPGPLMWPSWTLSLFFVYGLFEFFRGVSLGHPFLRSLQNLVFNLYPLYLFLGLFLGRRHPDGLPRIIRWFAWWNGLYGILYILFLSQVQWTLPWSPEINVFGQPGGTAVALIGLLAFERNILKVWLPFVLNAFVLLSLQIRSEWLEFLIGLLIWGLFMVKPWKMVAGLTLVGVLLGLGYIADFRLKSPVGRGGEISISELMGRAIAPFSVDAAADYTDNARVYSGTFQWRINWWKAIWYYVHDDSSRALIGYGYGYPLTSFVSYIKDASLRTPHNVFFYALAYGGWTGVLVFFAFQSSLSVLLWRSGRLAHQPFGAIYWNMSMAGAFFGNFLETPYGAIPFYLLIGMAAAPALAVKKRVYANFARALPLPAAGR